jgi:endonuclease/exonuclease/phosphatase family metal-dependent hydrolase
MNRSSIKHSFLVTLVLPALVVTLGLQLQRVLFPSLAWFLRDTLHVSTMTLAGLALAPFLVAFLAAPLRRLFKPRWALWLTVGGVAAFRLAEQLVRAPQVDLWLSMIGYACFLLFLPIFIGQARAQEPHRAAPRMVFGLALGLALDTAIHGLAGTLDLSWQTGAASLITVIVLALLAVLLLSMESPSGNWQHGEASWADALPLLSLGPALLLQAMIFQHQGWVSEVASLQPPVAFLLVMGGNVLLIAGATLAFARPRTMHPLVGLGFAAVLVFIGFRVEAHFGFIVALLVAQFITGWGWALIFSLAARSSTHGLVRTSISTAGGMLLFLLLALSYYISLDIALPFPRAVLIPAAAVLFALAIFAASLRVLRLPRTPFPELSPGVVALVLLAAPLLYWISVRSIPPAQPASGLPIKVMTYNVHSCFDVAGSQDPEAVAQAIESSGADIVALQEMSRGWLINGSTDLVTWLSHRLQMQVLFQGTTDPIWGNAILSRFAFEEHGWGTLPLAGTLMGRGYLWATFDVGTPQPLLFIATHLHHVEAEHEVRLVQVPVLLDFWNGAPTSLILGDLNSEPTYPEMDLFRQAGLIDSWAEAGTGEGLTWPSYGPFERIDWIWHTADLAASNAQVLDTTASDHAPVVAEIGLAAGE